MRLCKNCKYYLKVDKSTGYCVVLGKNQLVINPVSGEKATKDYGSRKVAAIDMRVMHNWCGIEGKLYEEK